MRQFISITQADDATAIACLSQNDWKFDIAIDSYFQHPNQFVHEKVASVDKKRLNSLFDKYKGSSSPYGS